MKNYALYSFIGIAVLGFGYLLVDTYEPVDTSGFSNEHWHATPTITLCGEKREIPSPLGTQHMGSALLHTHQDKLMHIEGSIDLSNPPTIGAFFKNIGVPFSSELIFNKKNGDLCPGSSTPGKVSLNVNGKKSTLFENQPIADGAVYEISFS